LILGNAKLPRNYLFEMLKIKEITRKGKIPKNGGNPRAKSTIAKNVSNN